MMFQSRSSLEGWAASMPTNKSSEGHLFMIAGRLQRGNIDKLSAAPVSGSQKEPAVKPVYVGEW